MSVLWAVPLVRKIPLDHVLVLSFDRWGCFSLVIYPVGWIYGLVRSVSLTLLLSYRRSVEVQRRPTTNLCDHMRNEMQKTG